jgi:hypothetical protein
VLIALVLLVCGERRGSERSLTHSMRETNSTFMRVSERCFFIIFEMLLVLSSG